MKIRHLTFVILCCGLLFTTACTQAPKADEAKVEEAKKEPTATAAPANTKRLVDAQKSKVTWVGTKPVGQHQGTFNVKSGFATIADGKLAGGTVVIDLNSLTVTDEGMDDGTKGQLAGHLKSPDFFETEKHPDAKFTITGVTDYKAPADGEKALLEGATHTVSGNLTLKGVTKNVSFPAVVDLGGDKLAMKANFNIDRSLWGLSYGNDESLGDKFIRPTVNVGFDLVTK